MNKWLYCAAAILIGFGIAKATAPSKDCESPTAMGVLKQLAERKLGENFQVKEYLMPYSGLHNTEKAIDASIRNGTLTLTPSAIRDRGSLGSSGRECAAFIAMSFPTADPKQQGIFYALVFTASYSVEQTRDGRTVVLAAFHPK